MKVLLTLFSLLLFACGASFAVEPVADTPVVTQAKAIRLPKVEFRDATIKEALDFLIQKSRTADPKQQGVNMAIAGVISPEARVSLSLTDASLYDTLQVIAGQTELSLQPAETVIMLVPKAK